MSTRPFLSLYKKVLTLHRKSLPELHRSIGDSYVRQEFRAHRDVNAEQRRQFMQQWEEYVAHIEVEAGIFGLGRDLPDHEIESLSDEQKVQLQKLEQSATSVGVKARTEAGENPFEDVKPR